LRIDHVGYCKRPNPLFADWLKYICNRKNKKSAPEYIKEAPKYIKGVYNHPEEEFGPASEETLPHVP
jgi:hypothetical protein